MDVKPTQMDHTPITINLSADEAVRLYGNTMRQCACCGIMTAQGQVWLSLDANRVARRVCFECIDFHRNPEVEAKAKAKKKGKDLNGSDQDM